MLQIETIPTTGYQSRCYLLWDDSEHKGVIIDPSAQMEEIENVLLKKDVSPERILLTHGHFDHLFSLDIMRDRYGIPACIHEGDASFLSDPVKNASASLIWEKHTYRPAEVLLHDDDIIMVGSESLRVISTPGHSPGSVCFLSENALLTGDTLFSDNIGRTDLFGGDAHMLRASLQRLELLGKDYQIYPGHGPQGRLNRIIHPAIEWLLQNA